MRNKVKVCTLKMIDLYKYVLLSSLVVTGLHSYTSVGCFFDTGSSRVWPWTSGDNLRYQHTLEKCTAYCRNLNKRYAGAEFGQECFCGNTYPDKGLSHNCNKPCAGNPSQICGGGDAMSVYFVCTTGTYKSSDGGCSNVCDLCENGKVCHHITGECKCLDNHYWDGNTCIPCGQCKGGGCSDTEECLNGCRDGYKMPNCHVCDADFHKSVSGDSCEACGNCKESDQCDVGNGQCPRDCKDNWKPKLCKECITMFYQNGSNCLPCGNCKNNEACNVMTGHCENGCKDLWAEPMCLNCQPNVYRHIISGSCIESCGHCRNGNACSEENGHCPAGCAKGRQKPFCKDCADGFYEVNKAECQACGYCVEISCDRINGHCSDAGCKAGYRGDICKQWCTFRTYGKNCKSSCSVNCGGYGGCDGATGRCSNGCKRGWKADDCETKCEEGKYGAECSGTCSSPINCKDGAICHHVDGSCPDGCEPGFKGDQCLQPCEDGKYGFGCYNTCSGNCKSNDYCNPTTGICPYGCKDGWTGTHCTSRCSGNFYGPGCNTSCGQCAGDGKCNFASGHCDHGCKPGYHMDKCILACNEGFYGQYCVEVCGNCSSLDVCNPVNGSCKNDCKPGWKGNKCDQVCPKGSFGLGCSGSCGHCKGKCHPENGICDLKGCTPGYIGMNCSLECDPGFYGKNCNETCKCKTERNVCDRTNGTCPVIEQEPLTGTPGAAIGGGLGAIILIVVLVIVIIVIIRGRKRSRKSDPAYVNNNSREFGSSAHENDYEHVNDVNQLDETAINIPAPVTATPNVLPPVKTPRASGGVNDKHQNSNQNKPPTPTKPKVNQKPTLPVKPMVQTPGPSSNTDESGIYENKDLRLKISEVGVYIKKQKQEEKGFENEYLSLPGGQTASWAVATNPVNSKTRNRYKNIYAYDHSRVPLKTTPNGSDYINANFINGYKAKHKFIATQGPKNTCDDLWTMIWEQNVTMVVMVTNIKEGDKNKSDKYWPDIEDEVTFGDITVINTEEQEMPGFTIRTLQVKKEKDVSKTIYGNTEESERKVLQFHFTEWPDKDVPKHGTTILNFVRKIKTESTGLKAPIVVHCSAGVGRTGTFIAIDCLLDQAKVEKMIDVYICVKEMRENRIKMVQTMEQYIFIYDTMYEAVMVGDTSIQCFEFGQVYSSMKTVDRGTGISRLEEQYKMLKTIAAEEIQERNIEAAISEENIHKNRSKEVLPANSHRMYLTTTIPGRNYYINSVFSKSYNKNHGVVLTQLPLLDTIVDFWRMVYDYNIDSIVMLTSYQEKESKMVSYWPFETETVEAGPFTIRQKDMKRTGAMICCHLVVEYKKESREVYLTGTVDWSDDKWKPKNRSTFYELFSTIQAWQQKQKKAGKIAIQCLDGGMNSSMYAVVSWIFDMINAEQAVDIFQITKQVVTARPEFLVEQEQYEEFYKIAEDYMKNFQTYSNFQ